MTLPETPEPEWIDGMWRITLPADATQEQFQAAVERLQRIGQGVVRIVHDVPDTEFWIDER